MNSIKNDCAITKHAHKKYDIGVYGMGVMGKNLALNLASKGYKVAVYNKTYEKTKETIIESRKHMMSNIDGFKNIQSFVQSIDIPRKVLIMVPSGNIVDLVIHELLPYISKNDILIDGGNEWFENTEKRQDVLFESNGVHYIGMGVSGGEKGARFGPSLMPSGDKEAYEIIEHYLISIAAKAYNADKTVYPCVMHIGSGGSGHYVKMIHNGIEYGLMQIISEIYYTLKVLYEYSNEQIANFFENANETLQSYLLEITIYILRKKDQNTNNTTYLLDMILDKPRMNGTGTWTSLEGFKNNTAIPSISSAVESRIISADKDTRTQLYNMWDYVELHEKRHNYVRPSLEKLKKTLDIAFFMCYLQGFTLLKNKDKQKKWNINIQKCASIWKGGCIIRSNILDFFETTNIDSYQIEGFQKYAHCMIGMQAFIEYCVQCSIPIPTLSATYQYIISYKTPYNSSNLIQAQRDYFGSHGFERIDETGFFHETDWISK